jgi:hypothetical protein
MYPKLLALVIFFGLLAFTTLILRQQRLETMHKIVRTHAQINHDRQATWDYQVRIASQLDPESLAKAALDQGIKLRPLFDTPIVEARRADEKPDGPEDGRFVSLPSEAQVPEAARAPKVNMVRVSPGLGNGQGPIMIPVLDPQPASRPTMRQGTQR